MNFKINIRYIIMILLLLAFAVYHNRSEIQKHNITKAKNLVDQGNLEANRGQWNSAINKYNKAILLGDDYTKSWAYNCRGIIYWRKYAYGSKNEIYFEKALKDYDQAEKLATSCYAAVLCNKGLLYASKGEAETSMKFFDEGIKCNPKDYKIYEEKTNALFDLGWYKETIEFGENALKTVGQSDEIYFNIAYAYEMLNNYEKAIEYYDKELKFSNYQTKASFINASYCKLMLNDYNGAIEYSQNAIKLGSRSVHPFNFITYAALKKGNLELATEYCNQAFTKSNVNYMTYYNYARIKYLNGDIEGARTRLEKARKLFEKDTNVWKFEGFEWLCDDLERDLTLRH